MIDRFKDEYSFLSNFFLLSTPIEYEGEFYKTTEHAYQATKVVSSIVKKEIRDCERAWQAKRMGNDALARPDWEDVRVGVMKELIHLKFKDPILRRLLLQTGEELLVERNYWHDNFWGSCHCDTCADRGRNVLGVLLMDERRRIMEEIAAGK